MDMVKMVKTNSLNKEKTESLRKLFPLTIEVMVHSLKEGGFYAEIETFPGCVTQADTLSELIEMVNDAVATVLEIPKEYLSHMPTYIPPISLLQRLNLYPSLMIDDRVAFSLSPTCE